MHKLNTFFCLQFIKFSFVGASNALISLGVYSLLVYLGLHYIAANTLTFTFAVLYSFLLNSIFVFRKSENESRNTFLTLLKTFATYGTTGILIQSALLYLFIDVYGISKYLAQVFCILINLPLNFCLNKFWAYKTASKQGEKECE